MAKDFGAPGKSLPPDGRNATAIRLSLASPEMIRGWSWGEVKKPETINYRTFKPERDGLFCERIFGPVKSWECYCGKYKKLRHKDIVCDRCGVDVVDSRVRRERMGHIELEAPVAHVWFVRSVPSRMAVVMGMSGRDLEKVIYYEQFIVIKPGKTATHRRQLLSEYDFKKIQQEIHGKTIEAKMGAEAIYDLLSKIDLKQLSDMIRISMVLPIDIKDLELRVAYEEAYVVLEPGKAGTKAKLKKYEVISESVYREFAEESGFKAATGVDAVKGLLKEALARERTKDHKEISSQKMKELLRRLKVVEAFRDSDRADGSGNRPEWMILKVLPVQPPDLRPLVPLDGGRFATSDLNDLYRRVINRNSRLKKMIEIKAPEIIIRNEKRMLQESVDALFENGKGGHVYKGTGNRPLKSLSDMLKGKPGRFRQNLLGKRVDYSGRSVIVVGPELKLHECGLPKEMALELFKPFIMRKLEERDYVTTVKGAKKLVERSSPEVWGVLEDVIEEHPVLLNRAPTLHRLSVQAFLPVLVEGKAIQLHPLVCAAFNADFDGDQMAVHVPLSVEAQLEARLLMMATNNMLSPANGQPIVGPTQDMVMGVYYLTAAPTDGVGQLGVVKGAKSEDRRFIYTPEEVQQRFDQKTIVLRSNGNGGGLVGLHDRIMVRYGRSKPTLSTVGRTLFTLILPDRMRHELPYDQREMASHPFWGQIVARRSDLLGLGKREINRLIEHCYYHLGRTETILFLDRLKKLGFEYATRCGVTVGLDDVPNIDEEQISRIIAREQVRDPKAAERIRSEIRSKAEILGEARRKEAEIIDSYRKNAITDRERYKNIVTIWTQATNDVTGAMRRIMERSNGGLNPIHMMAHSGARGREDQVRQLAGMRGLMAKPSQRVTGDEIIEFPIESNFKEGLSVFEYFVSTHGARKGLADTALKTADAGYLTRRLVDVAQDVKIIEEDCGTINGIKVREIPQAGRDKPIEELEDRIQGRVAMDNIVVTVTEGDRVREEFLVQAGQMISRETAKLIADNLDSVMIRSVLTCDSKGGVCAKCYGKDLATGREYIGDDIRRLLDRIYRREIEINKRDISTDEARDAICAEVASDLAGKPGLAFSNEGFAAVHASFAGKFREAGGKSSVGEILVKMQREIDVHLGIDNGLVSIGEAVGVIAGQSIGEPGTQLTLRTFHVGGTADLNVARPFVRVPAEYGAGKSTLKVKYDSNLKAIKNAAYTMKVEQQKGRLRLYKASGSRMEEAVAFEAKGVRPDEVKAFHDRPLSVSINRGKMILIDESGKEDSLEVPNGAFIVEEGSTVRAGSVVAMWNPYTISIYAMRAGSTYLEDVEENRTMQITTGGERGGDSTVVEAAVVSEAQDAAARAMHPRLVVEDPEGGHDVPHTIPAGAELRVGELHNIEGRQSRVRHHDKVKAGQVLASGQGKEVKSGINGIVNIIGPNRMMVVPSVEVGDELARLPREEDRTGDITGGLPRVAELFDARRPKNCAVISEIDGRVLRYRRIIRVTVAKGEVREYLVPDDYVVEIDEKKEVNVTSGQVLASGPREPVKSDLDGVATIVDQETLRVRIKPPEGRVQLGFASGKTPGDYAIPPGRHLEVRNGDTVRAGDPLTDGSIDPHDVLKIGGPKKVQDFLLSKIQEVYRLQGVTINDKHIEVIIRQMLRKVSITTAGDTSFLAGQLVDRERFMEENRRVHKDGKRSAEQAPILLGVTRSALTTEGWVSAASFQETTRVLAEAAVHGREDRLAGLKENVIMGHLISAGTGLFDEEEISMEVPKELEVPPTAANISSRMDDALEAIKAIGEGLDEEPSPAEAAEKASAEAPEKETE